MKKYQLCGVGNAITDILIRVSENEFSDLGYEKGTMNLMEPAEQAALIRRFQTKELMMASGGSVANSVVTFAELGGQAAFTGCFADDKFGRFYDAEFKKYGIALACQPIAGGASGTCVSLITPDSERTMRTSLGVSADLNEARIDEGVIADSEWVFIEGYLFSNPASGQKAVAKALELAGFKGAKIALTFSDTWVIEHFRDSIEAAVAQAGLIFANEHEAMAYTRESTKEAAFEALSQKAPIVAMTAGADGAYLSYNNEKHHVPAFKTEPIDMTGAGDAFAGAFLYGISNNINPIQAVRGGCFLASKVIAQIGARLSGGVRQLWEQSIRTT